MNAISCSDILDSAVTMASTAILLFAAFAWLWRRNSKTWQAGFCAFALFLVTVASFLGSSVLAAWENPLSRIPFTIGCFLVLPCLGLAWLRTTKYDLDVTRLTTRATDDGCETHTTPGEE